MSIQKTTTELETLKINYLTQEMYEDALENDEINDNELYLTPSGGDGTSIPTANTIAEFDSNAHINSEDMSSQDVSDFVDGLNTSGINAVDYVIREGATVDTTSQQGYYRKWHSGKAEFWYHYNADSGLTTSAWVSPVYYQDKTEFSSIWDGVFNATPYYVTCTSNNSQVISVYPFSWTSTGISTLRILTLNAKSNVGYNFSIYAVGTWK